MGLVLDPLESDEITPTIDPGGDDALALRRHHLVSRGRLARPGPRAQAQHGTQEQSDASHRNPSRRRTRHSRKKELPTGIESNILGCGPEASRRSGAGAVPSPPIVLRATTP